MNRRSLFTYTFLLYLLVQAGMGVAMDSHDPTAIFNDFLQGYTPMLEQVDKDPFVPFRSEKDAQRAQWENTVLLGHKQFPMALYRRDLIELPFFVADLSMAYMFFDYFKEKRVNHIYKALTSNVNDTITTLTEVQKKLKEVEKKDNAHDAHETEQLDALFGELSKQHHYIGYNPFRMELIIPLLALIAGYKASSYLRQKSIIQRSFIPEAHYAWTQKPDGSYEQFTLDPSFNPSTESLKKEVVECGKIDQNKGPTELLALCYRMGKLSINCIRKWLFWADAPLSTMTGTKIFGAHNANAPASDQGLPIDRALESASPQDFWGKFAYKSCGLPDWLYNIRNNRLTYRALEIGSFLMISIIINNLYHTVWLTHIKTNTDELIALLQAYKATRHLPNKDPEKQLVEQDLKAFITTGNYIAANSIRQAVEQFFTFKWLGQLTTYGRVNQWMVVIIASILLYKARKVPYFAYIVWQTGIYKEISVPAALIALGITLELSLLFGPVLIQSSMNVYSDLVWIKNKLKNYLLGKKEQDDAESDEQKTTATPASV